MYQRKRKRSTSSVVIQNPRDDRKYTSMKSALEYVARGAAVFTADDCLEFVKEAPRAAFIAGAVRDSAEATYDRAAGSGLASIKALEGLPAIGDVVKMLVKPGDCRKAPRYFTRPAVLVFHEAA